MLDFETREEAGTVPEETERDISKTFFDWASSRVF